jgi:rhodanese-related sulfurtransferase
MERLTKNSLIKLSTIIMAVWLVSQGALAATALELIEQSLVEDSQIKQVSSDYVLAALGAPNNGEPTALVFDVREREEFAVSHLAGAIRLDPDTSAEQFVHDYGKRLAGVTPIFYCAVGKRSNTLAEAVAAYTNEQASPVLPVNLRGGIFRWHNENKPLENTQGATDRVHPYDGYWRRLLIHPERSAYEPTQP